MKYSKKNITQKEQIYKENIKNVIECEKLLLYNITEHLHFLRHVFTVYVFTLKL